MLVPPVFYKAVDGPSPGLSRHRWPIDGVARAGSVLARPGIADIPGGAVTAAGRLPICSQSSVIATT